MKEKPCTLHDFYNLVYYVLVIQEYKHRSEPKKKASTSLKKIFEKIFFFSKMLEESVNKRRKGK